MSVKRDAKMRTTALLIGGTGFAGSHLQRLLAHEYNVIVTGQDADVTNRACMTGLLKRTAPAFVVNLASVTTVKESFADPRRTYQVGFLGTLNVLLALRESNFKGRMLNISSSEVYGFPSEHELPLKESAPTRPMSPYSVSKAACEALCYQWALTEGFEIVTARPFTHIGPGQSDKLPISSFAKQIAEILLKRRKPVLHVGDLRAARDLTDVRDVVAAYKALMEKGLNAELYNICSGTEVGMQHVVEEMIRLAGIPIVIREDERLLRKAEPRRTRGSFAKLKEQTGWLPTISLSRTLQETVRYWRKRLDRESH